MPLSGSVLESSPGPVLLGTAKHAVRVGVSMVSSHPTSLSTADAGEHLSVIDTEKKIPLLAPG